MTMQAGTTVRAGQNGGAGGAGGGESARAGSGEWATSATMDEIAAALRGAPAVVVTTHAKPDGDAAGSTLAIARSLRRAGVRAEVWCVGPLPRWMREFFGDVTLREFVPGKPATMVEGGAAPAMEGAVCVVADTGSWTQLAELRPWLESRSATTIVLDHHLHGDPGSGARRVVDSACASATQVVAPLCVRLCGVVGAARLPVDIAGPLYLGLATDTGWFRYSSVTPGTLRLAADLIEAGVDHTRLYGMIEQQDVAGRWRLLGRALSTLELRSVHGPDDTAVMSLTLADFDETGADRNDTSGFADMLLTVSSVRVSAVLTENPVGAGEPPLTKYSLRSKPGADAVDVNQVCQRLGGGGHARAAGAKARVAPAEAKRMLLEALR